MTLVEKSGIACAASGKAGGFLALDWCDGGPVSSLARASFLLHQQLAEELDGSASYGYRRLNTLSLGIQEQLTSNSEKSGLKFTSHSKNSELIPSWVDGNGAVNPASIGTPQTTAQVHPQFFTRAVLSAAVEKYGLNVVMGEVQKVELEGGNEVRGVVVDGELVRGDAVVLALGPWSSKNEVISGLLRISGLKAHSIVLRPQNPEAIGPQALFLKYVTAQGISMDPEVYPRPTGEVYICGMSEEVEVPDDPQQVLPRKESIEMLQRIAQAVSSQLANAELQAEQACFLPCSDDGRPAIGKIPDINGAYVATGHSCWGILNAPATGASLAELIIDGHSKIVDLKPFDPARFKRATRKISIF